MVLPGPAGVLSGLHAHTAAVVVLLSVVVTKLYAVLVRWTVMVEFP